MNRIRVPIAYVVGGPDDIARPNATADVNALPAGIPAYMAMRSTGDHMTVSTTQAILTDEVAGIGLQWFDLVLTGSPSALESLTTNPCAACPPGTWTTGSKNLQSLTER